MDYAWGGARPNSGRKPIHDPAANARLVKKAIPDRQCVAVLKKLGEMAVEGNLGAIRLFLAYKMGRPATQVSDIEVEVEGVITEAELLAYQLNVLRIMGPNPNEQPTDPWEGCASPAPPDPRTPSVSAGPAPAPPHESSIGEGPALNNNGLEVDVSPAPTRRTPSVSTGLVTVPATTNNGWEGCASAAPPDPRTPSVSAGPVTTPATTNNGLEVDVSPARQPGAEPPARAP